MRNDAIINVKDILEFIKIYKDKMPHSLLEICMDLKNVFTLTLNKNGSNKPLLQTLSFIKAEITDSLYNVQSKSKSEMYKFLKQQCIVGVLWLICRANDIALKPLCLKNWCYNNKEIQHFGVLFGKRNNLSQFILQHTDLSHCNVWFWIFNFKLCEYMSDFTEEEYVKHKCDERVKCK